MSNISSLSCKQCGTALLMRTRFCPHCGTSLPVASPPQGVHNPCIFGLNPLQKEPASSVDKTGAQLLFQLVSDLYEKVLVIITSNLRFGDWNSIFADPTLTAAFLDRLTHKERIIEFVGVSYRYCHRLQEDDTKGV